MELVLYTYERDILWKKLIGDKYGKEERGWCSYEVRDTYESAYGKV